MLVKQMAAINTGTKLWHQPNLELYYNKFKPFSWIIGDKPINRKGNSPKIGLRFLIDKLKLR